MVHIHNHFSNHFSTLQTMTNMYMVIQASQGYVYPWYNSKCKDEGHEDCAWIIIKTVEWLDSGVWVIRALLKYVTRGWDK
jgi:hypothetical protein